MPKGKGGRVRVFFAHPFDKRYRQLVALFQDAFPSDDFELRVWDSRTPGVSHEAELIKELDSCDALVAVVVDKDGWPLTEARRFAKASKERRRRTYVFVRESLKNLPELHSIAPENTYHFDLRNTTAIVPQLNKVVGDIHKLSDAYVLNHMRKRVRILEDGFGVVTYITTLKATGQTHNTARLVRGRVKLTPEVIRRVGHGLPPISMMWDKRIQPFRERLPSFTCRVLTPSANDLTIADVRDLTGRRDEDERVFDIYFNRRLRPKEAVTYGWGITFPRLYRITGADSTSIRPVKNCDAITIEIGFELARPTSADVEFSEQPSLTHKDSDGKIKVSGDTVEAERSLCFKKFIWRQIPDVQKDESLTVEWRVSNRKGRR